MESWVEEGLCCVAEMKVDSELDKGVDWHIFWLAKTPFVGGWLAYRARFCAIRSTRGARERSWVISTLDEEGGFGPTTALSNTFSSNTFFSDLMVRSFLF
jgi:hypothetical protein